MALSLEVTDRFARTFIDFWRLRPKRFLSAVARSPMDYLTPYQFLVASLGIVFAMLVATIALVQGTMQGVTGQAPVTPAQALAVRTTVFVVANLVVGSLIFRSISRVWPVKGIASFRTIFELQCYMMAIITPLAAIDVLVAPIIAELVGRNITPGWTALLPSGLGLIVGFAGFLFWNMPGVAHLNGVSTARLWLGLLFWSLVLGVAGGILAVAVLIALGK